MIVQWNFRSFFICEINMNSIGFLTDFRVLNPFEIIDHRDVRIINTILASVCVQKTLQIQVKILKTIKQFKSIE